MTTRGRVLVGDVVQVPLANGNFGYGYVLKEPLIAFFDYEGPLDTLDCHKLTEGPIAFSIWVHNKPFSDGSWPVVGHVEPTPRFMEPRPFFKQDAISKKISITYDGGEEIRASPEECQSLERAAVWEPAQVVERLGDHFAGRSNRWVKILKFQAEAP